MKTQHGTLTKKSGNWLGHYSRWLLDADSGEKVRQQKAFVIGPVDGTTKAAARRVLRERIEQELGLRSDSRVTVQWFVEHRWKPLREGSWRDSTKATNEHLLRLITGRFGTVAPEDADAVELQQWINELARKKSKSLVLHVRIFLKSIFAEAVEQDYVRKSPARLLRVPSGLKQGIKTYLKKEQIKALFGAAKGMDRVLLRVLLVTGLRPSELFALQWRDLDLDHKYLRVVRSIYRGKVRDYTKTTNQDSAKELTRVFLPDSIVAELRTLREKTAHNHNEDFVFASEYGMAVWKENYQQRVLTPLARDAGIPKVNFQILRRTVATLAQRLGSPKDIAAIMRHRKPDTAAIHYTQQQDESVRSTAEKLAALLS
jgi:integrase